MAAQLQAPVLPNKPSRKLSKIENIQQMIEQVRVLVLQEYEEDKDSFHPIDIERVRQDDWYIERFIRRRKTVKESAEMLINTLKFRKEIHISDLKESDFPSEFFKIGAMFCYANDKQGNGVVYMRARYHRKIKELEHEIRQFVMYHIDRMDMKTNGNGMAIVVDFKGAGLSNFDMDVTWFLINSLLNYFPYGMSYILIIDLPWIFTSTWAIIKKMLPAETKNKIKMANKEQIFEYFDKENVPVYLGGKCKMNYHYVPTECQSVVSYLQKYKNVSDKCINRILDTWKTDMEEAEQEIKLLSHIK